MARQENGDNDEGGRWDVGFKGDAVYLERRSPDGDQLFSDRLAAGEARELAALLNKFADKAESSDESRSSDEDDSDDEKDRGDEDDSDDENDSNDEDSSGDDEDSSDEDSDEDSGRGS